MIFIFSHCRATWMCLITLAWGIATTSIAHFAAVIHAISIQLSLENYHWWWPCFLGPGYASPSLLLSPLSLSLPLLFPFPRTGENSSASGGKDGGGRQGVVVGGTIVSRGGSTDMVVPSTAGGVPSITRMFRLARCAPRSNSSLENSSWTVSTYPGTINYTFTLFLDICHVLFYVFSSSIFFLKMDLVYPCNELLLLLPLLLLLTAFLMHYIKCIRRFGGLPKAGCTWKETLKAHLIELHEFGSVGERSAHISHVMSW